MTVIKPAFSSFITATCEHLLQEALPEPAGGTWFILAPRAQLCVPSTHLPASTPPQLSATCFSSPCTTVSKSEWETKDENHCQLKFSLSPPSISDAAAQMLAFAQAMSIPRGTMLSPRCEAAGCQRIKPTEIDKAGCNCSAELPLFSPDGHVLFLWYKKGNRKFFLYM